MQTERRGQIVQGGCSNYGYALKANAPGVHALPVSGLSILCGRGTAAQLTRRGWPYDGRADRFPNIGWRGRSGPRIRGGDGIVSRGDDAKELFVIQNGQVEIRLGNRVLETLSDYNIFGEMADAAPRSATAVAVTDVKLVPVGEKHFSFSHQPYTPFCGQRFARHGAASACIQPHMNSAVV
jgi:Cyclic nucleotide-binding domain